MKIIQSFWSGNNKHTTDHSYAWLSGKHHILGWILSVNQLRKYYNEVELYTDTSGYKLLIERLQLPYTKVHVVLDCLNNYHQDVWALAKVKAYSMVNEPFLHVDGDVFIWKAFSDKLHASGLICQNKETITDYYGKMWAKMQPYLKYLPPCMEDFVAGKYHISYNMGIFGGHNLQFITEYCKQVFDFVNKNQQILEQINIFNFNIFFEQVFFAVLSDNKNNQVSTLFKEVIPDNGYTGISDFDSIPDRNSYLHLLGPYKRNKEVLIKLETYVLKYYPEFYRRMENVLGSSVKLSNSGIQYTKADNKAMIAAFARHLSSNEEDSHRMKNENETRHLLGRNLFMEGQCQLLTTLIASKKTFIIKSVKGFKLTKNENRKKTIEIKQLDNSWLQMPLLDLDILIFDVIKDSCSNHDFEDKALIFLSDDFPEEEKKNFLNTLWKRIYHFISLNVLAIVRDIQL